MPTSIFHTNGLKWLVAGWSTSGVYQLASGFPFAVYAGEPADQMAEFYTGRFLANTTGQNSSGFKKTLGQNFETAKYSTPPLGRYGNTNKSPERTPFYTNLDASFGKTTPLGDRMSLMLRADVFNLGSTWHSNTGLLFPDSTVTDSNFGSLVNPSYGPVSLWNPRTIQLTGQFNF